ncbi:MAG TPA: hypothetical protein VHT93_19080, partial [Pseudolabrys sp.]|nr:hypothetical protein [Pseudolabrys sp.]
MAGMNPAIHVTSLPLRLLDVDARHKLAPGPAEGRTRLAGHDGGIANPNFAAFISSPPDLRGFPELHPAGAFYCVAFYRLVRIASHA